MSKTYTIQGFEGSFHQMAVAKYTGNKASVICCATFAETFNLTKNNPTCHGAVVAIENSIAGSILPNYTLLQQSKLYIVGEIYLPIKQHLLANHGVTLAQIKEVHSHPMALLQCSKYLDATHFKLVETDDTALSAKYIQHHKHTTKAAIASSLAANLYNLQILVPNIHTNANNYTRFLILEKQKLTLTNDCNKATIYFAAQHTIGSLAKVLTLIAKEGINLSKLQSFPVAGSNFNYYFYADIEFDTPQQFITINNILQKNTINYKVLGVYKNGKRNNTTKTNKK